MQPKGYGEENVSGADFKRQSGKKRRLSVENPFPIRRFEPYNARFPVDFPDDSNAEPSIHARRTFGEYPRWERFRSQMAVVRKWAYFDHAAVSPLPNPTADTVVAWAREQAENGVASWLKVQGTV